MVDAQGLRWLAAKSGPRLVFGNDGTWSDNIEGISALRHLRRSAPVTAEDPRSAQAGRILRKRGWLSIPAFPVEIMDPIRRGYERAIEDSTATRDMGARDRSAVRYVVDPVKQVPELRLLLSEAVRSVLIGYYRTHFCLQHVRMWRIKPLTTDERFQYNYGNLWHCDPHRVTVMKLFVQVSEDVSAENGALRMHDIPTTRLIMRSGFISRTRQVALAQRLIEDEKRMVVFDGPPGSALIMNPNLCLHRAGVPLPGRTRGMVQLTFDVADHPPPAGDYFAELAPDINVIEGRPV